MYHPHWADWFPRFTSSIPASLRCFWHFISDPEFCFDCTLLLWVQNIDDTSLGCSLGDVKGTLENSAEHSDLLRTAGLCRGITSLWIRCITPRKYLHGLRWTCQYLTLHCFTWNILGCWAAGESRVQEKCVACGSSPLWQEVLGSVVVPSSSIGTTGGSQPWSPAAEKVHPI